MTQKIKIALVDDHGLFREGFSHLLQSIGFSVIGKFKNGKEFISNLSAENLPDFVFTGFNMSHLNGYELTKWLADNYPNINVLALCLNEEESEIEKIIDNGAKGFIFKDIEPNEIKSAIESTIEKGFYKPTRSNRFH